jgi:F-type H+-transporting ATPase subunit a
MIHMLTSTPLVLAASDIQPGHHPTFQFLGLTFNSDTLIATGVAMVILLGLGLYMARGASAGKPTKLQLIFETLVEWVRDQVADGMGVKAPKGVTELGVTLFAFILVCNWLAALPTEKFIPPPTADVNFVYPVALVVIGWVIVVSVRRQGRHYLDHFLQPMGPIEFLTQFFARPLSLALRLWGNIFAGALMVEVIALMPAYVIWLPNAAWKLFDMFIGLLQALIFSLLTILYFSEAVTVQHGEEAAH